RAALGGRALREALLQPRDEIDDRRRLALFRLDDGDLLSLQLRVNDLHQILAILVDVFRRIERAREMTDELLGHRELLGPPRRGRGKRQAFHVYDLVGEAHDLEYERVADDAHRREMVRIRPKRDLPDAHRVRLAYGLAQERVGTITALGREQIVRC